MGSCCAIASAASAMAAGLARNLAHGPVVLCSCLTSFLTHPADVALAVEAVRHNHMLKHKCKTGMVYVASISMTLGQMLDYIK